MSETHILEFDNSRLIPLLYGERNANLQYIERKLGISISDRGNRLTLQGNDNAVQSARRVLNELYERAQKNQDITTQDIDSLLRFAGAAKDAPKTNGGGSVSTRKKPVAPRSPNQAAYIEAIRRYPMVFGLGPAGTGKTYLAVATGVSMFLNGDVERLIFCRPAVEAGERIGFLPGDMKEKVDPYLRPIYDALHDMMPPDMIERKIETGEIEIAPLAFMRGRTLARAFVILDEAQNTTPSQMKMFLTRMGESSRMVITGDPTQTDLPAHTKSGLSDAIETIGGIDDIAFIRFEKGDVVRHPLVGRIVDAYDSRKT